MDFRKVKIILVVFVVLVGLVGLAFFLIGYFRPRKAGILIETTPNASVSINGIQVGRTPYEATREPGEVVIKLVPESADRAFAPFEAKVNLSSGIKTIVRREFAESDDASAGEIISFEKVGGSEVSISVVSVPDAAQIAIDGTVRGFAPLKTTSLVVGEHQLIVSKPGYQERSLAIKTVPGYKLIALVKLAPGGEASPSPTPLPTPAEKKTLIEILTTPTGFLRVRSQPGSGGSEVAQVKPGQKFPFIDEDEKTGWFKIEYLPAQAGNKAKEGWVSNQYAKKVEEPTASPTPR